MIAAGLLAPVATRPELRLRGVRMHFVPLELRPAANDQIADRPDLAECDKEQAQFERIVARELSGETEF